jgi:hypothetical protein
MLEHFVLSDEMRKQKAQGRLMKKKEKIEYVTKRKKNKKTKRYLMMEGSWNLRWVIFLPLLRSNL